MSLGFPMVRAFTTSCVCVCKHIHTHTHTHTHMYIGANLTLYIYIYIYYIGANITVHHGPYFSEDNIVEDGILDSKCMVRQTDVFSYYRMCSLTIECVFLL